MNSIRLLASITPRGCNLIEAGGTGKSSKDELLGALRGVDSQTLDLLFAKYQSSAESLIQLCKTRPSDDMKYNRLTSEVALLAEQENWRIRERKQDKLRSLLNLVILESLDPKCPTCKGTKYYRNKHCNACAVSVGGKAYSTGKYTFSESQRARAMGIHRKNWKPWIDRRIKVVKIVQNAEAEGLNIIFRNMIERA
jgi:hypothetical protein